MSYKDCIFLRVGIIECFVCEHMFYSGLCSRKYAEAIKTFLFRIRKMVQRAYACDE